MEDKETKYCYCCCTYVFTDKIFKYILSNQKLSFNKSYDGMGAICSNCTEESYFLKYENSIKIKSFDTEEELDIFYKKYSLLK